MNADKQELNICLTISSAFLLGFAEKFWSILNFMFYTASAFIVQNAEHWGIIILPHFYLCVSLHFCQVTATWRYFSLSIATSVFLSESTKKLTGKHEEEKCLSAFANKCQGTFSFHSYLGISCRFHRETQHFSVKTLRNGNRKYLCVSQRKRWEREEG